MLLRIRIIVDFEAGDDWTEPPKAAIITTFASAKPAAKWLGPAQSGLANDSSPVPCHCQSGE